MKKLLELAKKLRSEEGCPWDREQTIESMKDCIREELDELDDAIIKKDFDNLEEEVGDILFCLIMLVQIAEEDSEINFKKVMERIEKKIISRHTWVFGDDKASTAEEALEIWKKNKKKEI